MEDGARIEVDVTPAMIEAGVTVLRESGRLEFEGSDDPLLVREILLAAFETDAIIYVTKQDSMAYNQYEQAGALSQLEEVTPEMIQAGVSAYLDWDSKDDWSLGRLAESLYLAMREKAPRPSRSS